LNAAFLDTVGLLATWDRNDQWHHAASAAYARIREEEVLLFTTPFVLAECANAAARRTFRSAVVTLWRSLDEASCILAPDDAQCRGAWEAYAADRIGGAGLVDQISFSIMRRYGLRRAFTNDRHFAAVGFETLF
jgi:predicted nucleic acid-binding protein